jgi:hypothetical protein
MGRQTSGVTAMRLRREDQVLAMEVVRSNADLLVVTDAGYGKRTPLEQYARKGRGIQGVKTAELTEARGFIAGALVVQDEDDIFLITDTGQIIRTRVNEVRRAGRATQGVRIMRLARTSGRVAAGGAGRQGRGVANVQPVPAGDDAAAAPTGGLRHGACGRPPGPAGAAPARPLVGAEVLGGLLLCLMLISLLVFAVIWFVLVNMGVFTSLTDFAASSTSRWPSPRARCSAGTPSSACSGVVVWSVVTVLLTLLFNLVNDVTGGIEVVLAEREQRRPGS